MRPSSCNDYSNYNVYEAIIELIQLQYFIGKAFLRKGKHWRALATFRSAIAEALT